MTILRAVLPRELRSLESDASPLPHGATPMIERDHPVYMYQQVADHLRDRILVGDLSKCRRLPSQPQLAREFQVALTTLRRAVAVLQEEGVVKVVPSRGMFGPEVRGRGD